MGRRGVAATPFAFQMNRYGFSVFLQWTSSQRTVWFILV
jgi:hypothetical protein